MVLFGDLAGRGVSSWDWILSRAPLVADTPGMGDVSRRIRIDSACLRVRLMFLLCLVSVGDVVSMSSGTGEDLVWSVFLGSLSLCQSKTTFERHMSQPPYRWHRGIWRLTVRNGEQGLSLQGTPLTGQ